MAIDGSDLNRLDMSSTNHTSVGQKGLILGMGLLPSNYSFLVTDSPGRPDGKLEPSEYLALITILSVLVVVAILFAIYGLFIKAEAHKHSDHLDNGNNLLFIGTGESMFGTGLDDV